MSEVSEKEAMDAQVNDVIDNLLKPLYDAKLTRPSSPHIIAVGKTVENLRQYLSTLLGNEGKELDPMREWLHAAARGEPDFTTSGDALDESQARLSAAKHKAVENALRSLHEHRQAETAELEALAESWMQKSYRQELNILRAKELREIIAKRKGDADG